VFSELSNKQFIPFSDGCLLFDETEQSVLILNQTAAFIWCSSFDVNSKNELVDLLADNFSISHKQAQQDIEQFYRYVRKSHPFLAKENESGSFLTPVGNTATTCRLHNKPPALSFSIHKKAFSLTVPTATLRAELADIYSYFINVETNTIVLDSEHFIDVCIEKKSNGVFYSIVSDQQCIVQDLLIENVVPTVFSIVFEIIWRSQIRENSDQALMFHAAVLAQDKGAVIFPAESGSGKSTLAAVLASKGWMFFTDELAMIMPELFSVTACPLPICVKPGSIDFLSAFYPQLTLLKQYHRLDNKKVRYLPVIASEMDCSTQTPIKMIIFPLYNKQIQCKLQSIDKKQALSNFLNCGSSGRSLTLDELSSVVQMIERLPCYALTYSDIDRAIKKINSVYISI